MQDQAILLVDAQEVVDTEEVLDVTINNTCTGVTFTFTDILYPDNLPGCLGLLISVCDWVHVHGGDARGPVRRAVGTSR